MPSKQSRNVSHPPLGTLIDDDSLELVEVLGVGGYGVVYRAVDHCSPSPRSYAVKCLMRSYQQSARQRQLQIREITLHQLVGSHPNVVTLHRVVEDDNFLFIIMDYATDHDLFTQILHNCRYLGDDYLIKHVFMQMLDAVEYCHSLGIYHRDLKPENILCFDDGLRVAITDFGLATTDKVSDEFRTGSVYHMSPECQGGEFAPTGTYSPMFNDIWSLGIILLNLATGRNPWKSATLSDATFQAYLADPLGFLPTVLPISDELNAILVRMLEVDWRDRMTLPELRMAMEDLTVFYSEGAIFEGSMARCPWESLMEIDAAAAEPSTGANFVDVPQAQKQHDRSQPPLKSVWSADTTETTSDMVFARNPHVLLDEDDDDWNDYSSDTMWALGSSRSSNSSLDHGYPEPRTPSSAGSEYSTPSFLPPTAESVRMGLADATNLPSRPRLALSVNTNCFGSQYYPSNISMDTYATTPASSMMHTAVEYDPYSSSFFIGTPVSATDKRMPNPVLMATSPSGVIDEEKEDEDETDMIVAISPSQWGGPSPSETSLPSLYSSLKGSSFHDIDLDLEPPSNISTPETVVWPEFRNMVSHPYDTSTPPHVPARPLSPTKKLLEATRLSKVFHHPIKLFPPASKSAPTTSSIEMNENRIPGGFSLFSRSTPSPPPPSTPSWVAQPPPRASTMPQRTFRSRHWFLPGRLFASSE